MNNTDKKLFQALTESDDALKGAIFTTYNFDVDYFESTLLPGILSIDLEDETEPTLQALDIVHALEQIPITVIADAKSNLKAHRKIPNYELRLVWDTTQHSKISCLIYEKSIRLIVSSANITNDGIHKNREVYIQLDIKNGEDEWKILEEVISFLNKISEANDLGKIPSLDLLNQKFKELKPSSYLESNLKFIPVTPLGDRVDFAKEFSDYWKRNNMDGRVKPEILTFYIQTPFFETSSNPDSNLITSIRKEVKDTLNQKILPEFAIFIPTYEAKRVTAFPVEAYSKQEEMAYYENEIKIKEHRFPHLKTYFLTDHAYFSLFMMGSSNFSPSALGTTIGKKPNWEANIMYFKKDYTKRDLKTFFMAANEIEAIEDSIEDLTLGFEEKEENQDPVVIQASYERGQLKVRLLKELDSDTVILLGERNLNALFSTTLLELPLEQLPSSSLIVYKNEEIYQTFPLSIPDQSFNEHIKLIPSDLIVKFIEARYKYNREVKPSEIIMAERQKMKVMKNEDLHIDTSNFILYQVKEFNRFMANFYQQLKLASNYPNQVRYHLNGKFGVLRWIEKYVEEANTTDKRVLKTYQVLETISQALFAFDECKNEESMQELNNFYDLAMKICQQIQFENKLRVQLQMYHQSIENLRTTIFEKANT